MNISAWAIKRPIPIILLFLFISIIGFGSFRQLGINENPDVDFPMVTITVAQPGASPNELETEVTRKVEDSLVGIANLEHIRSTVSEGVSLTMAEFKIGTNSQRALIDVRDAVARIRQQLPGDITEPTVMQPNFAGEPFITYTVASDKRSVAEISRWIDQEITRKILSVPGVAQVQRSGGVTREIRVQLNASRLQALGTTVDSVNAQLRMLNLNLPGGRGAIGSQEQGIRTLGSMKSVEELRALPISLGNGQFARLDTLGTVEDGVAEVRQKAFLDGKPVVGFSVVRAQGAALVQAEEATRKAVDELKQELPGDIRIDMVRTWADYTRAAYTASVDALLIGAILAVIVIFAFLRNWQSTLISALAIPLSILGTFIFMKWLGYTLNNMTLIGLTLVVGILVDDAIVDLENIHRHMAMGKNPFKAAIEATDEIGLAVVATTFTIVSVFVGVAFMGGIPGMFFRSFALTVTVSVLFSLLVARTLTPMMAAYLLPSPKHHDEQDTFYQTAYLKLLGASLRHRWLTIAAAVVIFIGSLALVPLIPKGLFGNADYGEATVNISLPAGSSLAETEAVVQAVNRVLATHHEVAKSFATIGSGDSSGFEGTAGSVSSAKVNVILKPKHERKMTVDEFQTAVTPALKAIPGARIDVNKLGGFGGTKPVSIILQGTDPVALDKAADGLLNDMRTLSDLRDVTSTAAELRPEIQIRPDFQRAAEQGVSVATIGRLARLATQGDSDFNLAKFNTGDRQLNIRVELTDTAKQDLDAIGNMMVPGRNGLVPLRSVATIAMGSGPVSISRYDRARQVTIGANMNAGVSLGDAMAKVQKLPTLQSLPAGVAQDTLGESKIMADIFMGFMTSFGLGILLTYAVLVLLFSGFLQPLTIMGALPLAIGGALAGLLIGRKELDMMALIGILMLMGLVTKNSILLVEYAMKMRADGHSRFDALLMAGKNRIRPILMTTIAMIAGMLPIALALGEGTESLSPMAVAVIGGLVTSTLLTLVVIPAAYTVVDDLQGLVRRVFRLGKSEDVSAEPSVPASAQVR